MRLPTVTLEGKNLSRIILSIKPLPSAGLQEILSLMRKAYEMDAWCFDLPTLRHQRSFKELKNLTEDETLMGLPHIAAEEGASLSGIPLHRFEAKVSATITKNLFSPDLIRKLKEMGAWRSINISFLPLLPPRSLPKKRSIGSPSIPPALTKPFLLFNRRPPLISWLEKDTAIGSWGWAESIFLRRWYQE